MWGHIEREERRANSCCITAYADSLLSTSSHIIQIYVPHSNSYKSTTYYLSVASGEAAAAALIQQLDALVNGGGGGGGGGVASPALEAARTENAKLKYSLITIEKGLAREGGRRTKELTCPAPAPAVAGAAAAVATTDVSTPHRGVAVAGVELSALEGWSVDKAVALITAGLCGKMGQCTAIVMLLPPVFRSLECSHPQRSESIWVNTNGGIMRKETGHFTSLFSTQSLILKC